MPTDSLTTALERLPKFSTIEIKQVVPQLTELLAENRNDIDALLEQQHAITWASFCEPFEKISDRLSRFWSPVGHLHGVADSDELRDAYNDAIPLLTQYATELAQSDKLCAAFRAMRDGDEYPSLTTAQKKVIDNALRDFRLGGIELDQSEREEYLEISQELAQLCTKFQENVLDATQAWTRNFLDASELAGLPESALALAAQTASQKNETGYTLTLDYPSYIPVMTYCENRALRREMYDAYVTRASEAGPQAGEFDNSANIDRILTLRGELAKLLGFANYAEYSLATKMAPSVDGVIEFLENLAAKSRSAAERDLDDLRSFAKAELGMSRIEPWDQAYCAEKYREAKFAISQEELRPYFPVPQVLSGLFDTVRQLFDIDVTAVSGPDVWHPDVTVYQINDQAGELRGLFYLDLYARESKRGGAWMDECIIRRRDDGGVQTPVAYLTCNFTPPVDNKPSLLTHDEVQTLFHEFGHGLHHMLTLVDQPSVSGINGVPWDGVELPSQFLENWCWEREALNVISGHVESGEPIPDETYQRMIAAKNFQSGLQMLRQIEFALFDFRLHAEYEAGLSVQGLLDDVRQQVAVIIPPDYNRFQHSFSHIFAGGYAAGYYSYKWAEVLSADAFSRFEDEGVFNRDTGTAFRECILERGGAEDTMELFKRFRGREPDVEPLLRHAGLTT